MENSEFSIYRVAFFAPPAPGCDRTVFYFSSLSAVFDLFPAAVVGVSLSRLWHLKIREDRPYVGKRCMISREKVRRKSQKSRQAR